MGANAIDRNPNHLHPALREAVADVLKECRAKGLKFELFEGYRTRARQAELYAWGRTKGGKRVTNAAPGQSFHQYGCAADLVLKINGRWSWEGARGWWEEMQRIGRAHGLVPLGREMPHLQMNIALHELQAGRYPDGADEEWLAWMDKQP